MCESSELQRLRERIAHLEEANRFTLEALSVAARLGDFQLVSGSLSTSLSILEETARRVGGLIRFKGMAFFLVDDATMEVSPAYFDMPHLQDLFLSEFARLTDDRTLAWVLQRKQPTIVDGAESGEDNQLIMHPISTAEKTVGLFIGLLDEEPQTILDASLSILSIVLLNSANTLEKRALEQFKERAQKDLETKVDQLRLEVERRKLSEHGLQNTRNFLHEVINTVPEPIFVKDKDHHFLMLNDAFCFFSGRSRESLLGKTSYDLFSREEADAFHRKDVKVMLSGVADTHETMISTLNGFRQFVSVKKASLVDPETGENVLVGIIRNLTDQKRAEHLLRLERERFFGVLESLPAFVYVQSSDNIAEYGNTAFREQFGIYEGKKCFELFHGSNRPCEPCHSREVATAGRPILEDREYPNGKTFQVYSHPFHDPDGTQKTIVMGIDTTERSKAIAALEESESKYRILVENANSLIIRWTCDGKLTFFNEYAQNFFGFSAEDVLGKPLVGTIVPLAESTGRELVPLMAEIASYPTAFSQNENENVRADGKRVWVSWSNQGIYDDAGELTEILSVGTDISARIIMEKELLKAKDEAEIASKAKSEFLANMSHEIRTPLNGVLGMLQLASISGVGGEVGSYVETALESGRNLLTIINDILDVSKIEAGKCVIEQASFSPRQVVDSVVRTFVHQAREVGLALNSCVDDTVPETLIGDGGRIRQVLFNLVGNAMKFTNQGEVCVSIHSLSPLTEGFHRLLFVVEDSGIGIPEEKVAYVFDAFTQVDGSYCRKYQGSGLGLGIVKRLVHLMGGIITIDTVLDQGTTIVFALEMRVPEPVFSVAGKKPIKSDFSPGDYRILLAEDNRVNQIMARKSLEKEGFSVDCCDNGAEVLTALKAKSYDCVLLDIQMPIMDGVEAAQRIRAGEAGMDNSTIPLVALTAYAMNDDKKHFLASGMNGVIAKPFDVHELTQTISDLLASRGA